MVKSVAQSVLVSLSLGLFSTSALAAESPPVEATEDSGTITMENGRLAMVISKKKADIVSLKYRHDGHETELGRSGIAMYFDSNGGPKRAPTDVELPRGGYAPLGSYADSVRLVRKGPGVAEAVLSGGPTSWFPFHTEIHYLLFRGESGLYAYAVFEHDKDMPAADLGQTRFALKGVPGTRIFTHHIVDDQRKGPFPIAKTVATVQDATYRLADGTIYTKYDNTAYEADHHVHGMAGHGLGLWMIFPSNEFIGGGPIKQELTVHMENELLGMLQGAHFGSGDLRLKDGEVWTKVFGPLFVYVNHGPSIDAMWDDAKRQAQVEVEKWPCSWLKNSEYPVVRGTVTGRVRLTDGAGTQGAWVILAPPGEDWTETSKGYDFWTRVDDEGRFTVAKVRPGHYTLFISGANQFEDFRRENVEVQARKATDLGELKWEPIKHGRTLWQIGVADRSTREFKGGDNYRHYGNFFRYQKEFPDDATFVIGKSKESDDWNFAQWSWYNKRPYWTIQFNVDQPLQGKATLTLGFASVEPPRGGRTNLEVKVNGREVSVVRLSKSGAAGYRSGSQDSIYNVVYIPFDASLLRPGLNEITLGHAEAQPFPSSGEQKHGRVGEVMYDAIRLEVDTEALGPKGEGKP